MLGIKSKKTIWHVFVMYMCDDNKTSNNYFDFYRSTEF